LAQKTPVLLTTHDNTLIRRCFGGVEQLPVQQILNPTILN